LVLYDSDSRTVTIAKGPSTPTSPDVGVLDVVRGALDEGLIGRTEYFLHGSTTALNAILERKGATVGLITTAGFRDVLELRRGDRARMNDYRWLPPAPLVARDARFEVTERILADGEVHTPLDLDQVDAAAAALIEAGLDAIAVTFINGYVNPEHELLARERILAAGFEGEIVLSHTVSREFKEYERTSTTVIDASVRPIMSSYLKRLDSGLRDLGFGGETLITNSGGGAMSFEEAETRAFLTIQSGPVAGAVATAELCAQLGFEKGIAADVGGTSFDTCLVVDGEPTMTYEAEVDGMPLQAPFVDVHSIGSGGGSLAYRDAGGLLRVGPQSAGAQPGPVAYGRGGTQPTVTDAAVVLGMLSAATLAGDLSLDVDGARRAVGELGDELGLDPLETARGIITIANAAMANAVREVSLQRGHDPRECALVSFGGAGPLFGALIAAELGCKKILVPIHAGNFSAWGLLGQDRVYSASQTFVREVDEDGVLALHEMTEELSSRLEGAGNDSAEVVTDTVIDVRYAGQEYTVTIPLPDTRDPAVVRETFDGTYRQTFGHALDDPIECVAVRVTRRHLLPRRELGKHAVGDGHEPKIAQAFSFADEGLTEFAVIARETLPVGASVHGPVIVTEETATTYIDRGFGAEIHTNGTMVISDERA
jgi:N-methylhydantoinase A